MKKPPRPDAARVERLRSAMSIENVVTKERAVLPCGCTVYVGLRVDNREAATLAEPCSEAHMVLIDRFNILLTESLRRPRRVLLVLVCRDLLARAAREKL